MCHRYIRAIRGNNRAVSHVRTAVPDFAINLSLRMMWRPPPNPAMQKR
jgi:hypothetical protein